MDVDQFINGHAGGGSFPAGVKLWYGQVDWKLNKTWSLWATVGGATAESLDMYPAGTEDDMGTEFDVNAKWSVMKNLAYKIRFGYMDAGELWKNANGITNLENTYTIYHNLTLKF